jgi:hypothetical protein
MVGLLCSLEHLSPWRQALWPASRGATTAAAAQQQLRQQQAPICLGSPVEGPTVQEKQDHALHIPDLEVKRAVDTVLLSPKDAGKMLSHGELPTW